MKVQRKYNGIGSVQFEVVEETSRFYILPGVCIGEYVAVSKADYEPVEEWVDVTDECHISESGGHSMLIMHNGYQVGTAAATACFSLYRLKATGSHGIRVERKKA
jgi:hypothetical protein